METSETIATLRGFINYIFISAFVIFKFRSQTRQAPVTSLTILMSFITRATPYFVRRNSRGSLPVYTDVRNGGTKYLVTIRNVQGQLNVIHVFLSFLLFLTASLVSCQRLKTIPLQPQFYRGQSIKSSGHSTKGPCHHGWALEE